MAMTRQEKILILAKTYPVPSAKYDETSCVAGINESGAMRRLFPIQFRFLEGERQFKKWQWVTVQVSKAASDHRPESHNIVQSSIECGPPIKPRGSWEERRFWLEKVPTFENEYQLEEARTTRLTTLALLYPVTNVRLEITPAREQDWTSDEKKNLLRYWQGDLFRPASAKAPVLQKVPFDFHYQYTVKSPEGCEMDQRHKIVDWEACRFYWTCRERYGPSWEEYFRKKLESELGGKDLMFLMGTMHRFPEQWLIISLIYPPKREPGYRAQGRLFY